MVLCAPRRWAHRKRVQQTGWVDVHADPQVDERWMREHRRMMVKVGGGGVVMLKLQSERKGKAAINAEVLPAQAAKAALHATQSTVTLSPLRNVRCNATPCDPPADNQTDQFPITILATHIGNKMACIQTRRRKQQRR